MLKPGQTVWAWDFVMGKRKPKKIYSPRVGILSAKKWEVTTQDDGSPAAWFIPLTPEDKPDYLLSEPVAGLNIEETEHDAVFNFEKALNDGLVTMLSNIQDFLSNYKERDVSPIRNTLENLASYINED